MKAQRKRESYELVEILSKTYRAADIAKLMGCDRRYVYRLAEELGIECKAAPPDELLERMDAALAKRCMLFRMKGDVPHETPDDKTVNQEAA